VNHLNSSRCRCVAQDGAAFESLTDDHDAREATCRFHGSGAARSATSTAVGDDRVLLLTTDRISAFDVVMAETIPMKGAVADPDQRVVVQRA